jgi:hypothetical protein
MGSHTRDCLRQLSSRDAAEAYHSILAEYQSSLATNKLITLGQLLSLQLAGATGLLKHISDFNLLIGKCRTQNVDISDDLAVAVFLQSLPRDFDMVVAAVRHQSGDIQLKRVLEAVTLESLSIHQRSHPSKADTDVNSGTVLFSASRSNKHCAHCRKDGHTKEACYRLHPCSGCGRKGHHISRCKNTGLKANLAEGEIIQLL